MRVLFIWSAVIAYIVGIIIYAFFPGAELLALTMFCISIFSTGLFGSYKIKRVYTFLLTDLNDNNYVVVAADSAEAYKIINSKYGAFVSGCTVIDPGMSVGLGCLVR